MKANTIEGIFARLQPQPNGCLIWPMAKNKDGYGQVGYQCKLWEVHSLAWFVANGPLPRGLELDHLCRNRACARLDHLEAVTHRTNCLRGNSPCAKKARQTHCIHGHPFDEANTLHYKGGRFCRTCQRARHRRYYHENKRRLAEDAP